MIDQQVIEMLDDPNPQVRADAVKQLAKTRSQDAVQYLAAIYKTDDDPEVRELARKAGLYIKKKMNEEKWTGGDPGPDVYDEPDEPEVIPVSARAVESSKGNMDTAMNLHVSGDDDKAAKFVEKAFTTNPNLKNDPYYLGMASTILGVKGEQVVELLLGDMEYDPKSGKAKRKRKPKSGDEVSTEKVVIDLVIYFIVIATIVAVGMLILISIFNTGIEVAIEESPEFAAIMSGELASDDIGQQMFVDIINGIAQGGVTLAVVTGIATGIYSVIVLLVQLGCMHVVATMMLGGEGTFKKLIHKVTGVITLFTVIYTLVVMLMIYLMFNGLINEDASTISIVYLLQGLMTLGSLGYLIWFVRALGRVYDFGAGSGCGTIIIGSILFGILIGIISAGFSAAFTPFLFNMMGGVPSWFLEFNL